MANPAMFKVTFTIICVKLESMSQAIYRLAGKFTLGNNCADGELLLLQFTVYIFDIEYI